MGVPTLPRNYTGVRDCTHIMLGKLFLQGRRTVEYAATNEDEDNIYIYA